MMGVQTALAVVLLFVATVKAADGNVEFWKEEVTMTCPQEGTWVINGEGINKTKLYKVKYEDKLSKVQHCEYSDKLKYYFYVKGKVCEHCYELDASLFGLIIVADVIGTGIVMMIIYRCTKKKGSARPVRSSKPPSRSGGPAPPTPSRDYEQLNVHTRSQDTYSIVNRTG